ncbi:aldehyde dehydrogenase [Novosphingobium sp.]|uniref:aldehyde dehydrogenase family protein n=1 Tax=Novosphingobium sp. TaxID=1874826 RepID=UPI0035B26CE9
MSEVMEQKAPAAANPFQAEYGHLIGGQWVGGSSGKLIDQFNPATGQLLGRIQAGSVEDARRAVQAAADAFPAWSKTSAAERQAILFEMLRRLKAREADFARMETLGNGKHIVESTHFDLAMTIDTFEYFAGTPFLANSGDLEATKDYTAMIFRQPIGVCAQIIPWNVPLLMMSMKIAPALACGNTVVLKPAETTSLSVLEFFREMEDLIPPGVINVLTGYGSEIGEALVTNPTVRKVAFTGSTMTGRKIIEYASKNIIPQTLELGGKSAQIVCKSANIDAAVEGVTASTVFNKGEVCLAGSRVFVHEAVRDEFVEKLVAQIRKIRIGDPLEWSTQLGAMASKAQFEKVSSYLDLAQEEGAVALTGGRPAAVEGQEQGYFIEPTILDNVNNQMRVAREEIFGPVTSLLTWSDEGDVVRQANDSPFGLGGGVWSRDITEANRIARGLDTGCVWINRYYNMKSGIPIGGFKMSGFGREGSREVLQHYTICKSVVMSTDDEPMGIFAH